MYKEFTSTGTTSTGRTIGPVYYTGKNKRDAKSGLRQQLSHLLIADETFKMNKVIDAPPYVIGQ